MGDIYTKFRRIGVPTLDLFSSRILKVCNLSRGKAQYGKPKIVFSRSTNTSPVPTRSNIIVHTQILTCVMTFFSQNASLFCKSQILKFRFEYYSSRVIALDLARYLYPSYSQIPSFFRVAKRGWVIRRNLVPIKIFWIFSEIWQASCSKKSGQIIF